jgi:hypothetical protein
MPPDHNNDPSSWDLREPAARSTTTTTTTTTGHSSSSSSQHHQLLLQQQQQVVEQLMPQLTTAAALSFPLDNWEELESLDLLFPTRGGSQDLQQLQQQQFNNEHQQQQLHNNDNSRSTSSSSFHSHHFQEEYSSSSPYAGRQRPDLAATAPRPAVAATPAIATRLHSVIQRGPRSSMAKVKKSAFFLSRIFNHGKN